MKSFLQILRRDLLLAFRQKADVLTSLLFFSIVVCLFPLALNPLPELIRTIAPAILWVAALLSALLSLDRLFIHDRDDGSLDILMLGTQPLSVPVFAKIVSHWLSSSFLVALISPLFGAMLGLPARANAILTVTLLLGTPVLSCIGAIGASLTVGLRQGHALLALLILPLYVPVLIFGAGVTSASMQGLPVTGQLYLIAAIMVLFITITPFLAALALRAATE